MPQKFSYDFVKEFLKLKNFNLLSTSYKNDHDKLLVQCLKCNDTNSYRLNDIRNGHGCAKCVGVKKLSFEEVLKFCLTKNVQVLTPKNNYKNTSDKLFLKCLVCSHEWKNNFIKIKHRNYGCPKCAPLKRKRTNLQRYGVDAPAKNKEVSLKGAKTANQITVLNDWFSGKEVWCRGSYEVVVVQYLNNNKIHFLWQPQTFTMPDNRTYTPDLYLVEEDKWVEIKGYFWGDAKEKWDWFHKEHPNSELWNKKQLQEKTLWKLVLSLQKNKETTVYK